MVLSLNHLHLLTTVLLLLLPVILSESLSPPLYDSNNKSHVSLTTCDVKTLFYFLPLLKELPSAHLFLHCGSGRHEIYLPSNLSFSNDNKPKVFDVINTDPTSIIVLHGNQATQLINVDPLVQLRLFRLNLHYGNASSIIPNGGAVNVSPQGKLVAVNCRFAYNSAAARGGAIHVRGGNAFFHQCKFFRNHGTSGGAVNGENAMLIFEQCTFEGNSVSGIIDGDARINGDGSAVRLYKGREEGLVVKDSLFLGHVHVGVSGSGSVLSVWGDGKERGIMRIENSNFELNEERRMKSKGLVVVEGTGNVIVKDCGFVTNTVSRGVLYTNMREGSEVTVEGNDFYANRHPVMGLDIPWYTCGKEEEGVVQDNIVESGFVDLQSTCLSNE